MNKAKNIFCVIFAGLLVILSITIVSLYDNVKENTNLKNNWRVGELFNEEFQYFTLAMIKEAFPEYEIFSYNQELPENIKQQINDDVLRTVNDIRYKFQNDHNFVYRVKNMTNNQVISNNLDKISSNDDKSSYTFYCKITYDANGKWQIDSDVNSNSFFQTETIRSLLEYSGYESADYQDYIMIDNYQININDIKINNASNLEIEYIIPKNVEGNGYLSSWINSWELYDGFSAVALIASTIVLIIFIFVYPIRIVKEVNPFKTIKSWKAEFNFIALFFVISACICGCMILTGYTINNSLILYLNNYNVANSQLIVLFINFLMWLITLLFIAIAIFLVKYIFSDGIWRYIKEDTVVGSSIRYFKNKLDMISEIDLSSSLNRKIMKYVLINSLAMIIIMALTWNIFILIIYTFVVFFWLKDKISKIQRDYNELLEATCQLGQGNFHANIENDLGIFNRLRDEFNNIKVGFKKAVEEETKSQNMKNELISNVSHDLKTPLTCIKNYIILLQDEQLSDDIKKQYLNNLNQYVNRLTTLIEDLFEVSKASSGNIKLNLVSLNVVALLEQAYTESEELLTSKQLTVIKNYSRNEIKANLDGDKTYRIFENLFTNISKYAMANSRVYLEIKEQDDNVIIQFKNISATQIDFLADEIVERFARGDKSRHEAGSGLGLAIAKSFTEIQNGKFKIEIDGDLFKAIICFKKSN